MLSNYKLKMNSEKCILSKYKKSITQVVPGYLNIPSIVYICRKKDGSEF